MGLAGFLLEIGIAVLLVWLHARIAIKAGYSPLWALTALIPPAYLVCAWFFAFLGWPRDEETPPAAARMDEGPQG
jgi:fatty-acid desaturase